MGKDNHTFQKLLHIGSEVISEDHHSDSRGLWSFSLGPSHSGSLRPPYGYLPSCRIGIDRLGNWQNSHIGSLIYGTWVVIVGKARWKPLEQPLPGEQLKKKKEKKHYAPGGTAEISVTFKDLKDTGVAVIPTHKPIQLTLLACVKDR